MLYTTEYRDVDRQSDRAARDAFGRPGRVAPMNPAPGFEVLRASLLDTLIGDLRARFEVDRCTLRLDVPGDIYPVVYEARTDRTRSLVGDTSVPVRGQPVVEALLRGADQIVQPDWRAASDDPAFVAMLETLRHRRPGGDGDPRRRPAAGDDLAARALRPAGMEPRGAPARLRRRRHGGRAARSRGLSDRPRQGRRRQVDPGEPGEQPQPHLARAPAGRLRRPRRAAGRRAARRDGRAARP